MEKFRLRAVLMLCAVFFVIALHAQVSPQTLVTIDVNNKTIPEVLTLLNKQTGLRFMYNQREGNPPLVSMHAKNQPLKDFLDDLLKPHHLIWTLDKNVLLVKKDVSAEKRVSGEPDSSNLITVMGTVSDEQGQPLAMATVADKATSHKTSTRTNGTYRISVDANSTLVFSFIGRKTTSIIVSGRTVINTFLPSDVNQLQDVVVNTGYSRVNARNLTGAVTTLKGADIDVAGFHTLDQMLEGRVPGMTFLQNSGKVGAAPKVSIRGTSTILGNQEPLWVIDGIVQQDPIHIDPSQLNNLDFTNLLGNAVSGLNPDDIEQVDVLKDASATAIYGVRAANGVIVITTKRGKKGPPVISYGVSGTLTRRPQYSDANVNVMNSYDRTNLSRQLIQQGISYPRVTEWVGYEQAYMDYYNKKITFGQFQQEVGRLETGNTDWFKLLMHNSLSSKHTLSISGGDGNINYYTSVGVDQNNGVTNGEYSNVYSILSKISATYKKVTFDVSLTGNTQRRKYDVNDAANYAYTTSRVLPAYDSNGSFHFYNKSSGYNGNTLYPYNILNEQANSNQKSSIDGIGLNTTISYHIVDPLRFGVTLGYQLDNSIQDVWHGYDSYYATLLRQPQPDGSIPTYSTMPYGDELQETTQRRVAYTVRPQLDFNKYLDGGLRHQLMATFGGELNSNHYTGKAQTTRGYLPTRGQQTASFDITQYPSYEFFLQSAAALGVRTDDLTRLASAYGSLTYNYSNRYLFNVNARIDGSNKFGTQSNQRLNPIWSVAGRWNIKDDLLTGVRWINSLNLRGSFGYQGDIADNQTSQLIIQREPNTTPSGEYYSTVVSFPNPFLRWEKTASYNAQIDFSLFGNKIQGTIAYWYKHTSDAFLLKNVSGINGITSYYVNDGTLDNHGIELALNFTPVNHLTQTRTGVKGFRWSFDPQLGSVINQFINKAFNNAYNSLKTNYTIQDYINGNVPVDGHALNTLWSYQYNGLSHDHGIPQFKGTDQSNQSSYDKLSQSQVWTTVLRPTGSRLPVVQGGLLNNFQYNRFYLTVNMSYSLGSKIRLASLYPNFDVSQGTNAPLPLQNAKRDLLNRWQQPGDEKKTNIPAIVGGSVFSSATSPWWLSSDYNFGSDPWTMYNNSDLRVVSGDFLKLQSFNFRYQLPDDWARKMSFRSIYFGLSGTNLFVWSARELRGQDPATATGTGPIPLSLRPTYSFTLNASL